MTDNEIKMQVQILDLKASLHSADMSISELRSMNEFLRSIILKFIDNGSH